ncbi:unnamed protein product [Amoebophrya sp. A120]|nr:unnamed protein product [Amoebophrya sp. A120]|eukprot:GSA120T00025822001.1
MQNQKRFYASCFGQQTYFLNVKFWGLEVVVSLYDSSGC